jgi:hypothetical protein
MKPIAHRTVSNAMPINAKNAALLRVMPEYTPYRFASGFPAVPVGAEALKGWCRM